LTDFAKLIPFSIGKYLVKTARRGGITTYTYTWTETRWWRNLHLFERYRFACWSSFPHRGF